MKLFKLFLKYIKKRWFLLIITVALVILLNYIRSIIPKLTSAFIAIIDKTPIEESELPFFLLPFYNGKEEISTQLLITSILIVSIAFIREIINIFCDVNIYKINVKYESFRTIISSC